MGHVALRRTTIGFAEPFYERLQEIAEEQGVSVSQLVREALVFYIGYESGMQAARQPLPRPARSAGSGKPGEPQQD